MATEIPSSFSREDWITPSEQLQRLRKPVTDKLRKLDALKKLPESILDRVAELSLPELTNWHTALQRLDLLPEKIPPLPLHIHQILDSKCPIRGSEKKSDGTHYKVRDTHFLTLIPDVTFNDFVARVNAYGQRLYAGENPLAFSYITPAIHQEHGDSRLKVKWILMSKDVLLESRNQPWKRQVKLVKELSKKSFVHYKIPSLDEAIIGIFLHFVATREKLYRERHPVGDGRYYRPTYTRVQDTEEGKHIVVGEFDSSGLHVYPDAYDIWGHGSEDDDGSYGVAALRLI